MANEDFKQAPQPNAEDMASSEPAHYAGQIISPLGTTIADQPTTAPQAMSQKKPFKKILLLPPILLIMLVGGAAAAWAGGLFKHESAATTTAVVKKDIPNMRYVTTASGWDAFYPNIDNSGNYAESNIMLFEGLVRYENKTKIVPLLATGWTNPDDETWVFNLKQGVKFHSGREMTAQDVKDAFEAAKTTDWGELDASTMKSIEVTGTYQVTIKTDGPDPVLLNKLTTYYVYDTKSGKDNDPINGTGAYVVKPGTTPEEKSLELVAFDQYHGGRPHLRSFSFIGMDENDTGQKFAEDKSDIMYLYGKPTVTGRSYTTAVVEPISVFLMPLNVKKAGSPLQNIKVRQAMQLSLDPAKISATRDTIGTATSQIVPNTVVGFNPNVAAPKRDITKAKKLLAEAGYTGKTPIQLTYYVSQQATVEEIQKELSEAGITVKLDPQTEVSALAQKAQNGGTDAYVITNSSEFADSSDVLSLYADNPNYTNQDVLDDLVKANQTLDATSRLKYLQSANKAVADDVGVIPVYQLGNEYVIYDSSYVIQRDQPNNALGIYFWKVYAK